MNRDVICEVEGWDGPPEVWTSYRALLAARPELERAKCYQHRDSPLHLARAMLEGLASMGPFRLVLCTPMPRPLGDEEPFDGTTEERAAHNAQMASARGAAIAALIAGLHEAAS